MSDDSELLSELAETNMSAIEKISRLYRVELHKAEVTMTYDEVKLYSFAMGPEWRLPTLVDLEAIPELDSYYSIWVEDDVVQLALRINRPQLKRGLILIKR